MSTEEYNGLEIAIIGTSGRFPGAKSVDAFWRNLCEGVESIARFTEQELRDAGVPAEIFKQPGYVPASGALVDVDLFDAGFFGYSPGEAETIDPQQRLFLECAWEAVEGAGYDAGRYKGLIGVYGGATKSTYLQHVFGDRPNPARLGALQSLLGNGPDFLSTRVAYKMDLKGPAMTVQTACSTSLVAAHLACQGLLSGECDMALAGGVSIQYPTAQGYPYVEGGIMSPDGHCRPFDARAAGTVPGRAVAVVLLKRLEDAVADGDSICAVIKGSGLNNDGAFKVGYTAPSTDGQAKAIRGALTMADVDPSTVSYIETHGTGTPLGDPIEIAALKKVYGTRSRDPGSCAIGSLKSNVGHLDAAAGVSGLIKASMALRDKQLPPSLHYETANPELGIENSAFRVQTELSRWENGESPRRAGVSSFGIGGTNAHMVLEEPPVLKPSGPARPYHVLVWSARTKSALDAMTHRLTDHLHRMDDKDFADAAYTLMAGRKAFAHRRMLVCRDRSDALAALASDPDRIEEDVHEPGHRPVTFMFTGQGSQYPCMGRELYDTEGVFKEHVDRGCSYLLDELDLDIRPLLFPEDHRKEEAAEALKRTEHAQPALFIIEHALAQLWMSWGVQPKAMVGHSIGEYAAACLAGVFSYEDALKLVTMRGRLMGALPTGSMLAVPLPEEETQALLNSSLSIAAVNAPGSCVVSGPSDAIEALETQLQARDVMSRKLHTSHAFHSAMMDPILPEFEAVVASMKPGKPTMRFLSNVTGTWIKDAEATDPSYWSKHIRSTVRFASTIEAINQEPRGILLEIGPGDTLCALARRQRQHAPGALIVSSLPHPKRAGSDRAHLVESIGRLWLGGLALDTDKYFKAETRHRVPLPTYPFDRQRYWIEAGASESSDKPVALSGKNPDLGSWFYLPSWKRSAAHAQPASAHEKTSVLVFSEAVGHSDLLTRRLEDDGYSVIRILPGKTFERASEDVYTIDPHRIEDYQRVLVELGERGTIPDHVVHGWTLGTSQDTRGVGAYSLMRFVQAWGHQGITSRVQILMCTNGALDVMGDETLDPEKAAILGISHVVGQEFPNITCRLIDMDSADEPDGHERASSLLTAEMISEAPEYAVAYRGRHRWVQSFQPVAIDAAQDETSRMRQGGVYVITGGLGKIGMVLAKDLARRYRAKLVLTSRTDLPEREAWDTWLLEHGDQDAVSRKIDLVRDLETCGSEVLVMTADVVDEAAMRRVLEETKARFGVLHGVLHAAGVTDVESLESLRTTSVEKCELQFHVKADGLVMLERVFRGEPLDFYMLFSSISTVLGGLNLGPYAAANAFMDSFARRQARQSEVPWISVDWDGWNFRGDDELAGFGANTMDLTMTPDEGIEVFHRILSAPLHPQWIVSTSDLAERLAQWVHRDHVEIAEEKPADVEASPAYERPDTGTDYVAPRTPVEETLAGIWQTVLGMNRVGVNDNFFELGGDSLMSIQIIARATQAGLTITPKLIFECQTIGALAEQIDPGGSSREEGSIDDEEPAPPPKENLPVTFAQERLWFLAQLDGDSDAYSIPVAIRLRGALRVDALRRSLNVIVGRHDVLRTSFQDVDGVVGAFVDPELELELPVRDIRGHTPDRCREEIERTFDELVHQPMDLENAPLIKGVLLHEREDEHVLIFNFHHLVFDGWSMGVFFSELSAIYNAFSKEEPSPLPDLPMQYTDYAAWQRSETVDHLYASETAYWLDQLEDAPTLLLPTDRPRPDVMSGRGHAEQYDLSADLVGAVEAICKEEKVTLFMGLVAAFNVLLQRYSSQEDIVLGMPVANRRHPGSLGLLGLFLNSVILRTQLSGDWSFRELLEHVRSVVTHALEHSEVPFEKLVEALRPERDQSRNPLFQVMIALQNAPAEAIKLDDVSFEPIPDLRLDSSMLDISLAMIRRDGGLHCLWEYNTDLFDASTVKGMHEHFEWVLQGLVREPDASIDSIELITEAEKTVMADASGALSAFPSEGCAHEFFEAQVERTPDATALVFEGQSLTYRALDQRANQLAHALREKGVGPETLVGICIERSFEMVIAVLGILKAGGAYVPMDPWYPEERLRFMVGDSQVPVLLTLNHLREKLPPFDGEVMCLDSGWDQIARYPAEPADVDVRAENLAYVIYTSGTTGEPKGAMIEHRSLCNLLHWMKSTFPLTASDCMAQKYSLSFDAATLEILWPLSAGARLVVSSADRHFDAQAFVQLMKEQHITILDLVPSMLQVLLDEEGFKSLTSLRHVFTGGEEITKELQQQFFAATDAALHNTYGPTETTVQSTCWTCTRDADDGRVPIGRPLANTEICVVDKKGRRVPMGVAGELLIGGVGLARGYLNRPELTDEKFIKHPFSQDANARLYRTGDLVRMRGDGVLEFLGRVDHQVKVRGYRIELGEVESHMRSLPGVKDVVVTTGRGRPHRAAAADDPDALADAMEALGDDEIEKLLAEVEALGEEEVELLLTDSMQDHAQPRALKRAHPGFEVSIARVSDTFARPPREHQRNWILQRALDEFADDLQHLDVVTRRFVPGSGRARMDDNWDASRAEYDGSQLLIQGQQVMQDWEIPLMKTMAQVVAASRGDILEIGFGMGLSASFIQECRVRSHTIVEYNEEVAKFFETWRQGYPDRNIRLIQGSWQELADELDVYDGIFFDAYPKDEKEFESSVLESKTFAEPFFPVASKLLRPGGIFTYYSNEIDTLSRGHQRSLLEHFSSFRVQVVRSLVPPEDCNYWWADSMVVVEAIK